MAKLKDGYYKQTAEAIGSDLHVLLAGGGSKALSDFATTSGVVTALGTNGNYVTWTKNGTANNLTVPYATKAGTLDCFARKATANCTWGTLTASNGYTPIYWGDSASGGGIGFSDKGGQTFMQIDGDYYAQEGAYKVWHAGNLTKVSQLTNDAGYLTSLPSHVHTYIQSKDNYTFTASTLPNSFDWGVSAGFVADNAGYGSYGSVLTVRTYTGGGGTLQLYAPYSKTYGGTRLKARFGDYDKSNGNSWTDLKEIAWTSDIPTKVSQLTNDSGYITGGPYLPLAGGTMTGSTTVNSSVFPAFVLNNTNSSGVESGIRFEMRGSNKGYVGYHNSYGTYIWNSTASRYLCIADDGKGYLRSTSTAYELIHSGNLTHQVGDWNSSVLSVFKSSENQISNAPTQDFCYGVHLRFHRDTAYYFTDLVTTLYSDNLYYRRHTEKGYSSWKRLAFVEDIPTSLPANGGNADTVDGYHASDLFRAYGTLGTGNSYDSDWGQSVVTFDPVVNGTYPESNPNVTILNLGNNYARRKQLAFNYSNNNIYFRRRLDSSWQPWVRLALASEIPSVTNYYWADQLITNSAKSNATPTFGNVNIKSGIDAGLAIYTSDAYSRIRFYNATNENKATIHYFGTAYSGYDFVKDSLNLGCLGLVTLGGWNNPTLVVSSNTTTSNSDGKVGIGTTSPSTKLDIVGGVQINSLYSLKIYSTYNYHPCLTDSAGRPGISISGYYPYLWLTGGGTSNANHGATITLAAPDTVGGTDGKLKSWTFGIAGQNATWMDLAYSVNTTNPHNGINKITCNGSGWSRVMRWNANPALVIIDGNGTDGSGSLIVNSARTGTWIYGASFFAPSISKGHNVWINIGKANSTRNSFGLSWHHAGGDGSTSNYGALEIYNVGNLQRWYADKHTEFLGRVDVANQSNSTNYMHSALLIREYNYGGSQSDTWGVAPRLSWHWGGRVQTQIALGSNGELYLSKDQFASAYKLVYETGTWNINIKGSAGSAAYHSGYNKTITVNGDPNTYYPVVISTTGNKTLPNIITIWKNLGTTTASYPGNHSNGTASCLYRYDVRSAVWDGNGGYCKCLNAWYGYATLVAHAEFTYSSVGDFCIWLRGGGTTYELNTTWDTSATVYYSRTDLYGSPYSCIVEPRTSIGNAGLYSNVYLGFGNITGSASYATNSRYVIGDNNAASPGYSLLQSGSGRADSSPGGDTWIYWDTLGGTASPWGILHEQYSNYISFYGAGNRRAFINLTDGCIYGAHFYENSDILLKLNILEILNSDKMPIIKEFDWKEDNSHSYGLIAQELEEQGYSELVSVKDDGYKTVNYSAALSLIVGKLQVKIKELEKEIEILKKKN